MMKRRIQHSHQEILQKNNGTHSANRGAMSSSVYRLKEEALIFLLVIFQESN
ncbi:hypothetical protein KIN20_004469 [Parelaphostrongylus tenuis]|uniref:Uncharacterized protein n=1 Tax=Parelaphostrongylus tenuis TaxID=148309 RepID=A0AAD5MHB2_PARTN|nr:hypothetical protein KIN20_004469 [Parelaphostrongylus tenuis]